MQYRFAKLIVVWLVILASSMTGCTKKDDISGTWKGKITLPETGKSLSDLEFSMKQKGQDVEGTMLFTKPGGKLPIKGTAAAGRVTLSSPMKNGLAVSISATLQDRRNIKGTALLDYDTPQTGKRHERAVIELTR